ncbi:LytTR family DNA-binding domain-containing protein [Mucilaginibacter sp. BJC16-A38]|uniref:LytR/AlgR family response regulator transcription factor n=1 Tax=Mucilaginibacter phenanthrenivorans TaxID=1234842 RepID=UPI002158385F|nr:LytTR family DNA-binding domain-containing protein [Mucilaginibacter phenanthrenivorans]MCR8556517.1 LytTR family DNA-binding domain-containing protein [Mucilaginibacter phenanthrenivorans]
MTIHCIAVDDEPVALEMIAAYIAKTRFLKLVGKCASAVTALNFLNEHPEVQLVFLDIRMADLNGLEFAGMIDQGDNRRSVRIVFTTAFDQYALDGHKLAALDYLLKPFSFADFTRAANRAREYFTLLEQDHERQYLHVYANYQQVRIDTAQIRYVESMADYIKIYLEDQPKPLKTLMTLKVAEQKLPASHFVRLHRSFIVAIDKVTAVSKTSVQVGRVAIPVSEPYREAFGNFMKSWRQPGS